MTPEEKFNQDVWWILQEIKKEEHATPNDEYVVLEYQDSDNLVPLKEDQRRALKLLEKEGAIKIKEEKYPLGMSRSAAELCGWKPTGCFLSILQPKFDEFYCLYEGGDSYSENQEFIPKSPKNKNLQPVIRPRSLELIAKEIGELDSGSNLVEFLTNCGVKRELIEYPNTKWRMVYSVLLTLASSQNEEDKRTLFKIIEEACHPLIYGGDKKLAQKTADKFNSLLEYDNFCIEDGILWEGWEDVSGIMTWYDKDGNTIEPACYLILPEVTDKLYVYWNELIKLTEFYLSNRDSQDDEIDDEINDIYFEIIANIEKLLNGDGCGKLKELYKRPFRNLIGCEFEIQKQDLAPNDLFVNLYDFLGKITEFLLPNKNNVEKIKKENSAFFTKIKKYREQHLTKEEPIIQEPSATKIEIVGGKGIDDLQDGLKAIAQSKKEDKNKFPYKLPAGTEWENFTIKFEDDENVFIQVKQYKYNTDYKEMGMVGRGKNPNPSEAWTFLKVLSQLNGELTIKDAEARDKYKKQKELLAKALQSYFLIDYDPFYPYRSSTEKSGNSYKIKITLIPPPNQNEREIINENKDDLGIKEYLDEQNPQVYQDEWRN